MPELAPIPAPLPDPLPVDVAKPRAVRCPRCGARLRVVRTVDIAKRTAIEVQAECRRCAKAFTRTLDQRGETVITEKAESVLLPVSKAAEIIEADR